jgi:hypothetical protein
MKAQKQFLIFVLLLSIFGCEVEPEDTDPGDKWVDVTDLSQASGTWKAKYEQEDPDNLAEKVQSEYTLDLYINLTVLTIVTTEGAAPDVANSWKGIKSTAGSVDAGADIDEENHSITTTMDVNLTIFEIKVRGDKLKIRPRGNATAQEIEMTKTSEGWSSLEAWTDIIGTWKGEYTENVTIEIPESLGTTKLSEVSIRFEIKLEVTGNESVAVTPTVTFSGNDISFLWPFIKQDYTDENKYTVDDANHTVFMITDDPVIADFEIHADRKKLRPQDSEMAIILFKEESENSPGEEPKEDPQE